MHLPRTPPPIAEFYRSMAEGGDGKAAMDWFVRHGMRPADTYLHWDELRHRTPPAGLTREQWWFALRFARSANARPLPLTDAAGRPFVFGLPDEVQRLLHDIDSAARGQITIDEAILDPAMRDRFVFRSLVEEAISSSQLEGAWTTHRVAKDMLRSGREPRDKSEWMILNNYEAMRRVRDAKVGRLTPEFVLDLHGTMTRNTLDSEDEAGRLRRDDEPVRVEDVHGQIVHVPPPADQLPDRMRAMCAFANGEIPDYFVHPIVRSIALHFWLAYDHPFVDGNGRTARTLFYWSMLRNEYWMFQFLPISRTLKRAPDAYARAFQHVETDANDLTYFLLQQLGVLQASLRDLDRHVRRKVAEVRAAEALLKQSASLNHRQMALVSHALRHPNSTYTIGSHQRSHDVVYATARTDLLELARRGVLKRRRVGRAFVFDPVPRMEERLRGLGK